MGLFRIMGHHGFHIRFDNGICVSVQFGGGNYGDNYNMPIGSEAEHNPLESSLAEVAAWNSLIPSSSKERKYCVNWITKEYPEFDGHDVQGWVSPNDLLSFLNWAAAYDTKERDDEDI